MADVSASVEDSWFISAKQGRDDDIAELISKIKDVNAKDALGNTGEKNNCN